MAGGALYYSFFNIRLDNIYVCVIRAIHYINSLRWTEGSAMRIVLRTPSRTHTFFVSAISLQIN